MSKNKGKAETNLTGKLAPTSAAPSDPFKIHDIDNGSRAVIHTSASSTSFHGPIPPPQILSEYDSIQPGLGGRIVAMAEDEALHRRKLETKLVDSGTSLQSRGQLFAFIIALAGMAISGLLIWFGKPLTGTAFAGTVLIALVIAFLKGRSDLKSDKDTKAH